ncbi:hypothetical protein [Rubrivirga sp. IMCC45206]|uniref:hypothetical protein n=1 Tax=Rubrivirga sp. IMCC45206 TaxID=3391614 RepID=UPI00399002B2
MDTPEPPDDAFVPAYAKPDAPGVHMGFDNTVALYHVVAPEDSFEDAAQAVFGLLQQAQEQFPGWPRTFYLDVAGHRGDAAGFDPDFYEFQQDFLFSTVAPFVQALETPVTGGLVNPQPQRNDVPDRLDIGDDTRPHSGQVIGDH